MKPRMNGGVWPAQPSVQSGTVEKDPLNYEAELLHSPGKGKNRPVSKFLLCLACSSSSLEKTGVEGRGGSWGTEARSLPDLLGKMLLGSWQAFCTVLPAPV